MKHITAAVKKYDRLTKTVWGDNENEYGEGVYIDGISLTDYKSIKFVRKDTIMARYLFEDDDYVTIVTFKGGKVKQIYALTRYAGRLTDRDRNIIGKKIRAHYHKYINASAKFWDDKNDLNLA